MHKWQSETESERRATIDVMPGLRFSTSLREPIEQWKLEEEEEEEDILDLG